MIAELWRDAAASVGCLTVVGAWTRAPDRQRLARAMLFFPLVGTLLGVSLIACAQWTRLGLASPPLRGVILVLVLAALSGGASLRALAGVVREAAAGRRGALAAGAVVAAIAMMCKSAALAMTPSELESYALLLGPVLGRWAPVVLAYGARPIRGGGGGTATGGFLVGRVSFREFGWASVIAFVVSLSVADALGLLAVASAAAVVTLLRLGAYRRCGGITAGMLGGGIEVIEIATFTLVALVARLGPPPALV